MQPGVLEAPPALSQLLGKAQSMFDGSHFQRTRENTAHGDFSQANLNAFIGASSFADGLNDFGVQDGCVVVHHSPPFVVLWCDSMQSQERLYSFSTGVVFTLRGCVSLGNKPFRRISEKWGLTANS